MEVEVNYYETLSEDKKTVKVMQITTWRKIGKSKRRRWLHLLLRKVIIKETRKEDRFAEIMYWNQTENGLVNSGNGTNKHGKDHISCTRDQ